jgi:hypothetical protein
MKLFSKMLDALLSGLSSDEARNAKIIKELRSCGFNFWQLKSLEVKHLADFLEKDEHILAAAYGHNPDKDKSIIVATDMRIVYMDYIPLFYSIDEVSYSAVRGVTYSTNGLRSTITLHTSQMDLTLRYIKLGMAKKFVDFIETKSIEN